MKRIVLLVAMVALASCSPDEQARQRAEAGDAFDDANKNLQAATAGYITDTSFAGTLEQFQTQELETAGEKLAPIVRKGTPGQQVAAGVALAAVEAAQGRRLAQEARVDWANQTRIANEMFATLAGAKRAQTLVDAHKALAASGELDKVNREKASAEKELREADAQIRAKMGEIARRTDRRTQLETERQGQAKKAAELSGRSFESTGQLRYDLHQQATKLARQADQLAAESDREALEISRLNAELKIAQIEKQQAEEQIASMQKIIDGFEQRKANLGMSLDEAEKLAKTLATDLVNQVNQRAEQHTAEVANPLTEARGHFAKAIDALEKARGVARGDARQTVTVNLATTQAELGFVMREEAVAHQAFADVLTALAEQVKQGFPTAQAATIRTIADDAVNRAANAKAEAVEALGKAGELLKDADQSTRSDPATRRLVLQTQLDVYGTLAEMTGSESARQEANGARAALKELASD